MTYTEKEYNDLYKYSLNVASKYVGYKDCAYDIAQNTMLSLISSKSEIISPFSWIRTTVRREATKFIALEKKEIEFVKQNHLEKSIVPVSSVQDDSADFLKLSSQKIKQILSPGDFEIYKKLKTHKFSATKYAENEKVSLNSVKTYKHRIKLNIISAYLLEDGWQRSVRILNYNQYVAINRFVTQIIDCVQKQKLSVMRNYLQRIDNTVIQKLFEGVDACLEWNVAYVEDVYKLIMVCSPFMPMPKIIEFSIKFHKANSVYIIDAKEKKPSLAVKSSSEELQRYKVKEKITLSEEQIVSILTHKQTKV